MGLKPISITDVARKCGCSIATVSLVLNGRGKISPATRKKVIRTAKRLGYFPNPAGRSLRSHRTNTIGLLFYPSCAQLFRNVFYAEVMETLEQCLGEAGYDLLLSGGNFALDEARSVSLIKQRRVDAAIMLGAFPFKQVEALSKVGVPFLLLDQDLDKLAVDSVTTDGFTAGRMIVDHLHSMGHRKMLMLAYALEDGNIDARIQGFLAGLNSHSLPARNCVIRNFKQNDEALPMLLRRLRGDSPPTAVVCVNDTMASYMLQHVKEAGFSIPSEVSFVGYDDDIFAREASPKLTTIGADKAGLARAGAECILRRINSPSLPISKVRLPVQLIERDSVARLTRS